MDWSDKRIEPRFNIAPSQEILTIVQEPLGPAFAQTATWGLKPFWLDSKKPPPINARAENLFSSPMFRDVRRCLIPATGFYEWRARQPMHIQLKDGQAFAFAGVWLPGDHGKLPTAAIVTTRPNELMATIHNRMPVILRAEDELRWLDASVDASATDWQQLLRPIEAHLLEAYPVSPLVNSWENEGPQLIEPSDAPPREVQGALPFTSDF